jgi:hypothetical protein
MGSFDKQEYNQILDCVKDRLVPFRDAVNAEQFIVLRHDVEFSIESAHVMASWENQKGVKSAYLFQVASDAYNVLSSVNRKLIGEIKEMGHDIGLHYYVDKSSNSIKQQREVLEMVVGSIELVSYHRPSQSMLIDTPLYVAGMINTYASNFFTYSGEPSDTISVKYCADSRRKWDYGYPIDCMGQYDKMQILIHPDWWSVESHNTLYNAVNLIDINANKFKNALVNETQHFRPFFK